MWFGLVGLSAILMVAATHALTLVTRQDPADQFLLPGRCKEESCLMESSGTGELGGTCTCRCLPHVPVYREDLQLCVDDIHECSLLPFTTGSVTQKIPYVFLPLKGQIINPSSEIVLSSLGSPICVISSAKYLTPSGWVELKNKSESYEPPFRLYRDEGRNYLQWLGGADLRMYMEGRLLLINMMCKDGSNQNNLILNPCVAFRVSGTPSETGRWPLGVKEVSFTNEAHGGSGNGIGSGYVIVALCSLALGVAYAAGVVWYLKRKNNKEPSPSQSSHPGVVEEGIVKNNPLLRHCQESRQSYHPSQGSSSDSDDCSEIFHVNDEITNQSSPLQVTAAMVHPRCHENHDIRLDEDIYSEGANASLKERHPEENVSIVETPEHRDDRIGVIGNQTGRRKLYFNPAYFEHELLLAPPPAAIEFLTKIREVMSIAKSKMESKRFLPSLMGIAEEKEEELESALNAEECASCRSTRSNKTNKIKCSKGAQCEGSTMSCHNCNNCSNENKVNSIRKWLEDVPFSKGGYASNPTPQTPSQQEYPPSIASSSRGSSRGSYLSKASTIKESATYADNVYSNCGKDGTSIIKEGAVFRANLVNVTGDSHQYEPTSQYEPTHQYELPHLYETTHQYEVTHPYEPTYEPDHQYEETSGNDVDDSASEIDENIYTEQRYEKFSLKPRDEYMNYECITENTCKELGIGIGIGVKSGFSTPTEYADIRPNIIEKVNCSIVFTRSGNNDYLTVGSEPAVIGRDESREEHDYEMIMVNSVDESKSLPDFTNDNHSFISEVYVNNDFRDNEYPRSDSSINSHDSTNSLLSNHAQTNDQGMLTIKVEGKNVSKDEYESDYFEPDTLDRKPAKLTIHGEPPNPAEITVDFFTDSLERQPQIALKSNGSFRNNEPLTAYPALPQRNRSVTQKAFGSLREIFVAKNRYNQCHHRPPFSGLLSSTRSLNQVSNFRWNKERYKTLRPESRQAKRQRAPSPRNMSLPPIPPEMDDNHEYYNNITLPDPDQPPPLPARKSRKAMAPLPPTPEPMLPPKREKRHPAGIRSGAVRNSIRLFNKLPELQGGRHLAPAPGSNSTTEYEFVTSENRERKPQFYLRKNQDNSSERGSKNYNRQGHRTEDSGYLSTDSNNSYKGPKNNRDVDREGSETDDSFFDGASESGAESIATDSFSFGKNLKYTTALPLYEYQIYDDSAQQI